MGFWGSEFDHEFVHSFTNFLAFTYLDSSPALLTSDDFIYIGDLSNEIARTKWPI